MTFDAFQCLRAMGDHAELFDLASAQAEAGKVAVALLKTATANADRTRLQSISQAVGAEAFEELAKKVGGPVISAAVDRIDGPATPRRTAAAALKRLKEIARGVEPAELLPPIDKATLAELRQHRGPALRGAIDKQPKKIKAALKRLDPRFPGLTKATPDEVVARLLRLAEGAEPVPEVRLADLDLVGLRRARAELGDLFEPWLRAHKGPDLKAAVVRIDPQRAKGRKLAAGEYPSILLEISGGGRLLAAEDEVDPIGQVRFSKQDG